MHALRLLSVAHNQVDTEYPKYPPQRTHAATDSRHLSLQQANGHVPRASAQTNKLTLQITSLEGLSAMRTIKYPCEYPEYPCEYPEYPAAEHIAGRAECDAPARVAADHSQ